MVRIRKGDHFLRVTKGAFLRLYQPMGYIIEGAEGDSNVPPAPEGVGSAPGMKNSSEDDDDEDEDEDEQEDDSEDESEDEESDEDELDEKPLTEMTKSELKTYAENLGIDTEGLNSRNKLLEAIREYEE